MTVFASRVFVLPFLLRFCCGSVRFLQQVFLVLLLAVLFGRR